MIKKSQLTSILSLAKPLETKDQAYSLQVKDGILEINIRKDGMLLKLKNVKIDEEDTKMMTIKKEFLNKIEKQNAEEFSLKFNKKTLGCKVNGVSFTTAILDEEINFEVTEEDPKGIEVEITNEIMESLMEASNFVEKDGKRPILQGIQMIVENKKTIISATDTSRLYVKEIDTESKEKIAVVLKQETVTFMAILSEITKKKAFKVTLTENAFYIKAKGFFFKSNLLEGTFPNVFKVTNSMETKDKNLEIEFNKEVLEKLRAIRSKTNVIEIQNEGEKIKFQTKTEIEKNTFEIESKQAEALSRKLNYENLLLSASIISKMEIREEFAYFREKNKYILILCLRD